MSALSMARRMATVCHPRLQTGLRCTVAARPTLQPVLSSRCAKYSTTVEHPNLVPHVDRSASKVYKSADEAVADIKSGSTILSAGFGLCGVAGNGPPILIDNLGRQEVEYPDC